MLRLLITIMGLGLVVHRGMVDWGISRGMVDSVVNRGMVDSVVNWGSMMNSMSTKSCERHSWATRDKGDKGNQSKDLEIKENRLMITFHLIV